ncbi:LCP family glycopolymer transferase [Gracilibacillus salinarum]|uniref:LCP family protein n=1 Tax=Gracilibacillus salinarum TaxID=2932255 RepID=A0ABY4GJW4_9BACI|nr:LCP family protein [Gracilibacillus salinarum]UOQ84483.1 LCP family protein [Gracilibacillus salinarum]
MTKIDDKELFTYLDDEKLNFTEKDRKQTFDKIYYKQHAQTDRKYPFAPIAGSLLVICIMLALFIPGLKDAIQQPASENSDMTYSVLIMGNSEEDRHMRRTNIHILLTYNKSNNSMKLLSLPRDTYVKIFNSQREVIVQDKLLHASAYNSTIKPVMQTVSHYLQVPIDYYAIVSEDKILSQLEIDRKQLIYKEPSFSDIQTLLNESETDIPSEIFEELQKVKNGVGTVEVVNISDGLQLQYKNNLVYQTVDEHTLNNTSEILNQHLEGQIKE